MEYKGTILCVDDEPIILKALKSQLTRKFGDDYNIELAESASEALEVITELTEAGEEIPLVISDQIMPEMKGDKLLQNIHQRQPSTLKILITGQASLDDVSSAVNNANLYRYIGKPWNETDLLMTIEEALKSYFQDKLLREQNVELKELNNSLEKKVSERTAKLKSQNEKLEDLHREKDGIISIVAHDLKSPFNRIGGITQLIPLSGKTNEEQKTYIDQIGLVVGQGNKLIQDLLDVSGIEKRYFYVDIEEIDIEKFINLWLIGYESELHRKKQNIEKQFKRNSLTLSTDKNLLYRILDNLLTNAIKFSEENTKIIITIWDDVNNIYFSVKDEGPGISEEDQKELFKKFKKLSATPTGGESSTGLGLSIVHALVEKVNGKIEVKSELHKGTEFIVSLPIQA